MLGHLPDRLGRDNRRSVGQLARGVGEPEQRLDRHHHPDRRPRWWLPHTGRRTPTRLVTRDVAQARILDLGLPVGPRIRAERGGRQIPVGFLVPGRDAIPNLTVTTPGRVTAARVAAINRRVPARCDRALRPVPPVADPPQHHIHQRIRPQLRPVRESPGSAIPTNASSTRSTDAASNDGRHALRKLTPSRSGRTDTYRSTTDRRIRSPANSGSTRATNRFNQRRNNSGVRRRAASTTTAFNIFFESSRTNVRNA